jgi:hypothetical protein
MLRRLLTGVVLVGLFFAPPRAVADDEHIDDSERIKKLYMLKGNPDGTVNCTPSCRMFEVCC